ncbi:MAG: GNAT family N-acetyltransferase [Acinetobacter sp.]
MKIQLGDFNDLQVQNLLRIHLLGMHETSPIENSFALDLTGLQKPNIQFYTLWQDDVLLACGAIQELSPTHAELKSMRTHPEHLRKGAATQILQHLLHIAKLNQYQKVSLETGTHASFEPAITLYKKFGFSKGEAFSDYEDSEFNQFFHLNLTTPQ